MPRFWRNKPILSWVVDDFEQLNSILSGFDLADYLEDYKRDSYDAISRVIFNSPFSLNLGGESKKNKLIATDKPIGVFNFSLASKTLYPLSEFYSFKLAQEDPTRFANLNLQAGVVPNILIQSIEIAGVKSYYYRDDNGNEYNCEKRIKGQTALDNGTPNAKLEYKSKTKKVFQTYKKKGGKVRYVELYSLFYYTSLDNDLQYAIRHLPAMMVADYLESVGVKVRIYMTRFVLLDDTVNLRQFGLANREPLPMYEQSAVQTENNSFYEQLLIQPIIAKEFQQEVNNPLSYLISSHDYRNVYDRVANNTIEQETTQGYVSIYGTPDWNQEQYWEGFERYRNKYLKYVNDGIFKSKEILPEAMLFFHDMSIKYNLSRFLDGVKNRYNSEKNTRFSQSEFILQPDVNAFFTWWMKTSANVIKHKVNIINSNELNKDLREIRNEVQDSYAEYLRVLEIIPQSVKDAFEDVGNSILSNLNIEIITLANGSQRVNFENYIEQITKEMTVFADDDFFPTPEEEVEKRTDFAQSVIDELKKV